MNARMWPCKEVDFSWSDAWFAFRACTGLLGKSRPVFEFDNETNKSFVCLSVRSAFDLYLSSRTWCADDECIYVGVNVPDMMRLAELHGLRIVAVDIDPLTTKVNLHELQSKFSKNTRFILIPHLFGYRGNIAEIVDIAQRYGVDVIEDCAQAFAGPSWTGTQTATVSLFSFGPLKTTSALQGGIAVVRDPKLLEVMKQRRIAYPRQSTWSYLMRVIRFMAFKLASGPVMYGLFVGTLRRFDVDHEQLVHALTKSVVGLSFIQSLRKVPSHALTRVIHTKVMCSQAAMTARTNAGMHLEQAIGPEVSLVLRDQRPHHFWMVPVLTPQALRLKHELRRHGFDAMSGRLSATGGHATTGAQALEDAVYLPFSSRMPVNELRRLGEVVTRFYSSANNRVSD